MGGSLSEEDTSSSSFVGGGGGGPSGSLSGCGGWKPCGSSRGATAPMSSSTEAQPNTSPNTKPMSPGSSHALTPRPPRGSPAE